MAKRKLTVRLNKDSIGMLVRYLEQYSLNLPTKCEEFVRKLGEAGIKVVNAEFAKTNASDYDTTHSTELRLSSFGAITQGTLIVEGEQVLFIEFGAGVHYNGAVGQSPHPKGREFGYTIGSYGKGKGRQDSWSYEADSGEWVRTYGVRAQMPVWKAAQEMMNLVKSTAKEVFG